LAHARPMTWSGWVLFGLGRVGPQFCVCNFRVGLGFFEFRVKYFGPYPTRHLIGSGRVFFGQVGSGLSGRVARDQVYPMGTFPSDAPLQH